MLLSGAVSPAIGADTITLPTQTVAPGEVNLTVNLVLPAGHKLNPEAPSTVGLTTGNKEVLALEEKYAQNLPAANLPLCLTVPAKEGKTTLQAHFRLNYCDDKIGLCFLNEGVVQLPVEVSKTATNKNLEMTYTVKRK